MLSRSADLPGAGGGRTRPEGGGGGGPPPGAGGGLRADGGGGGRTANIQVNEITAVMVKEFRGESTWRWWRPGHGVPQASKPAITQLMK